MNPYGYIYETTNIITNEKYIGKKKSNKFIASYLGSGNNIRKAIQIYKKENFKVVLLLWCFSDEELNKQETKFIEDCKLINSYNCYNIASGGDGGDVWKYASEEDKLIFEEKMKLINKKRCNTEDFKRKLSIATTKRYSNPVEVERHRNKLKKYWSDPDVIKQHSEKQKEYWKDKVRDCSFNNKACAFKLNNVYIEFESINDLRAYLKDIHGYNPDRRTFKKLMEQGEHQIGYNPFQKNDVKLNKLKGMIIYYL